MDGDQTGSEGPYCQWQLLSDAVHSFGVEPFVSAL